MSHAEAATAVGAPAHGFVHGTVGFMFAWLTVLVPMLVALRRKKAPRRKFRWAPFVALGVFFADMVPFLILSGLLDFAHWPRGGVLEVSLNVLVMAGSGYWYGLRYAWRGVLQDEYQRGAVVFAPAVSRRPWWDFRRGPPTEPPDRCDAPITVAGWQVHALDETKHFKFIGTTGTGKSTVIREMLRAALGRGDRAVIADPDGGYLKEFFDAKRGDVILNPFDPRSLKWNLLSEIETAPDVDQLARSMIPDSADADQVWAGYARTFFGAVLQQLVAAKVTDVAELYRIVNKASYAELKVLLEGTAAGPFLKESNDTMFASVHSVTNSAVGALQYIAAQEAAPFSVRQWIRQGLAAKNGGAGGVLFLPYKAGEIAALRAVISAWMRLAIFEAMNRDEGDQRLWFIVDELDALGEIDGLKDALARLRKFGGRCILGLQSISQVTSTYGQGVANTIVENCGNTLILRCSASEHGGTSQFASMLIGQREMVRVMFSKGWQPGQWRTSSGVSEQLIVESAVMASEIERLPDLVGYLKFASRGDWWLVRVARSS